MKVIEGSLIELESELFRHLAEIRAGDSLAPALVVTGSNLLAIYLRREYARRHGPAVNLTFTTLDQLVSRLAGETESFSPLAEELHLALTVEKQTLSYFRQAAETPGFKSAVLATLRDLMDGGIPVDSLSVLAEHKRADLVALYREFSGSGPFCHASKVYERASATVSSLKENFGVEAVFVYGFYEFTFVQERFVNRLDAACPVHRFKPTRTVVSRQNRVPDIRFISVANPVREADEIVNEIVQLAREGIGFDQIGVLLKNPEEYVELLIEYLDAAGIPYFTNAAFPLSRTPAGRSLLLFLALLQSDYPRTQVLDFIRSSTLDFERIIGENAPVLHAWEELSCDAGILSGRSRWISKLEGLQSRLQRRLSHPDSESGDILKQRGRQLDLFLSFMRRLFSWVDAFPQQASWSEFSAQAKRWVEKSVKDDFGPALMDELDELPVLDRLSARVSRDVFVQTVFRILEQSSVSQGRFQRGAVHICPLMNARAVRFPVVFVPGMVEREFPVLPSQDPIILDSEREAINARGHGRLLLKRERMQEEELLFNLVQQAAIDRLYLSYPRMEQDQLRPKITSRFILEKMGELEGKRVSYQSLREANQTEYPLARWAPQHRSRSISAQGFRMASLVAAERAGEPFLKEFFERSSTRMRSSLEFYRHQWQDRYFTEHEGVIADSAALKRVLVNNVYSPTQLEVFCTCPYRFLLGKIFRLEQIDPPDSQTRLSPLVKGKLIHGIFERFYRWALDSGKIPLSAAIYAELKDKLIACAEDEFRITEDAGLVGARFYWRLEKESIQVDLVRFLRKEIEEDSGYRPVYLEKAFGFDQPFAIDLGNGRSVRVRGKMDRLDHGPGGAFRVIDYKSGAVSQARANSFNRGRSLQLPLYLIAAAQIVSVGDFSRLSAEYYYSTGKGGFRRVVFDGTGWEEKRTKLFAILNLIDDQITAGHFFPVPGAQCRRCDFRRICDSRIQAIYDRKSQDPRAAGFQHLEEFD